MKKKYKILIGSAIFLLVIIIAIFFLNSYLKKEIEKGLEKEYPASVLSYEDISINAFAGKATIKNLKVKEGIYLLHSIEVNLDDFSYTDYLKDKNIIIGSIHLVKPMLTINKSDSTGTEKKSKGALAERKIRVKNLSASGGSINMVDNDTASNSLFASLVNFQIEEIIIEKMTEGSSLPFKYEKLNVESDSLFYDLSETHFIQSGTFKLENKNLGIKGFSIIPKYSKQDFDRRIPYEQDWIALKIENLMFSNLKWQKEEQELGLTIPTASIEDAHLEIYRNKLNNDDSRIKPMYSEMLRNLGFKLHMDTVNISNTYIEYQEKVLASRPAGKLSFHNVQVGIKNISNRDLDSPDFPQTIVEARALFMGETDLSLNWSFDVSNKMDEFRINGRLGAIKAEQINSFLVPAMNVEASGNIQSLYYDFYGNRNQANGKMQLSYKDFSVNILKDGEEESRTLLSRLANLIIKNDRMNEDIRQENITTTRDKTKSFWNFLWLCIRDGALKTFL